MLKSKLKRLLITSGLVLCLIVSPAIPTFGANKSGTSSVWAGVPLIGHVYVKTPWTVTYTGSGNTTNITKVSTGKSYTSAGIALIAYQAYDSWGTRTGKRTFETRARGHCDFVFKGCPISLGLQTFLAYESI